jgi:hypothetical protein
VQVAALGALWRAMRAGNATVATVLTDFAILRYVWTFKVSRIIKHYETVPAALQVARSLRIRAAVLRCRRTLAGAYDTSTPRIRDQKH